MASRDKQPFQQRWEQRCANGIASDDEEVDMLVGANNKRRTKKKDADAEEDDTENSMVVKT